jgi:hypothetical protein
MYDPAPITVSSPILTARLNDCVRLNRHTFPNLRGWIDDRGGMNTGRECDRLRRESEHDLFERFVG